MFVSQVGVVRGQKCGVRGKTSHLIPALRTSATNDDILVSSHPRASAWNVNCEPPASATSAMYCPGSWSSMFVCAFYKKKINIVML